MIRSLSLLAAVCLLAGPSLAFELDSAAPEKALATQAAPPPDPELLRQGGDTIADAVELSIPTFDLAGTTAGYTDDYDEVCPYSNSTSPDVVYTFQLDGDLYVDIDMFGSSYDTKIYVYDENLELVACNDDFYPDYVSKIEAMAVQAGMRYYLVIDGYGGDAGDYLLTIVDFHGEEVGCPAGATLENEPELVDGYVDLHNGGCNTPDAPGGPPFQHLASEFFCGVSGWYLVDGVDTRDTDWFTVTLPDAGVLTVEATVEFSMYLFELGPQDCDQVGVLQSVEIMTFSSGSITLQGDPGSTAWVWIGPTTFSGPVNEFDYVIMLDDPVATENHSWTGVKALFD